MKSTTTTSKIDAAFVFQTAGEYLHYQAKKGKDSNFKQVLVPKYIENIDNDPKIELGKN